MPTQLESFVHGYFQQVGLLKPPATLRSQKALSNRGERQKIASSVIWSLNNKITKANFFKPFEEAGVSKTVMQRLLNVAMEEIYESHPVMGDGRVISHQMMEGKDATYRRDYRGKKKACPDKQSCLAKSTQAYDGNDSPSNGKSSRKSADGVVQGGFAEGI